MSLIRDLAEIIAGLQVPHSINPAMLGAAAEPWRRIRTEHDMRGWLTAEDTEPLVRAAIGREVADALAHAPERQEAGV